MRLRVSDHESQLGQVRFKKKFLWFPKKIDGEVRWLETAMYSQVYELWSEQYVWMDRHWEDD